MAESFIPNSFAPQADAVHSSALFPAHRFTFKSRFLRVSSALQQLGGQHPELRHSCNEMASVFALLLEPIESLRAQSFMEPRQLPGRLNNIQSHLQDAIIANRRLFAACHTLSAAAEVLAAEIHSGAVIPSRSNVTYASALVRAAVPLQKVTDMASQLSLDSTHSLVVTSFVEALRWLTPCALEAVDRKQRQYAGVCANYQIDRIHTAANHAAAPALLQIMVQDMHCAMQRFWSGRLLHHHARQAHIAALARASNKLLIIAS